MASAKRPIPAKASTPNATGIKALAGERGELPEGWEWHTLGEVAPIDTSPVLPKNYPDQLFNYIALENIESGTGRLIGFALTLGAAIGSNKSRFSTAHVLYGKLRPYLNKVLVPEFDGVCATDILPLRPDPERLTRVYLALWLRSPDFVEYTRTKMEGAKMPRLRTPDFTRAMIAVPPLPEQRRIVARIEEFARRVEETRGLRREAVEWVETLMPEARREVFDKLAQARCERQPLSEVTSFLGRGRSTQQGESPLRLIKTRHVYPDGLRPFDDCRLSDKEAAKCAPERVLQPGDVLVCSSAAGCLGRPGFFAGHPFPCTTDTHVAIVRGDPTRLDQRYLFHYVQSPQGQFELLSREQGGKWQEEKVGFRLTELNLADLRTVPIPLPPLGEQRRIVAYLDSLQAKSEAIRAAQAETQKELDALMPSVLARAFAGEL